MQVTIVGAGLVGSLTATLLARRGYSVELHEKRADLRKEPISAGKSINLAVSIRGLHALEQAGLRDEVLKIAIPMPGRRVHGASAGGAPTPVVFQKYGRSEADFIYSIPRGDLNRLLMDAAEATGRVRIHFRSEFVPKTDPETFVLGADGAYSAVRAFIQENAPAPKRSTESVLDYGYKELTIPGGRGCPFEPAGLHIWPRETFMLIALPNWDGSFTCTLFLPHEKRPGVPSFAELRTPTEVRALFDREFPDAARWIGDLETSFFANPTGAMVTVKARPWSWGKYLVLGDAAHAIVPFFGQGMNCGFEDVTALMAILDSGVPLAEAGPSLEKARADNADAIADMAVANFVEMRDKVGRPEFLLEKSVEQRLMREFPGEFISRYQLVSFTRVPYAMAKEVGEAQDRILGELSRGLSSAEEVELARAREAIERELGPVLSRWREKGRGVERWI